MNSFHKTIFDQCEYNGRVLVCGGRDYSKQEELRRILNNFHNEKTITHLISGAASGADTLAFWWAVRNSIEVLSYPADWQKLGKSAGPIRNHQMLKEGKPCLVIAFPGGPGTEHMCRITLLARINLWKMSQ